MLIFIKIAKIKVTFALLPFLFLLPNSGEAASGDDGNDKKFAMLNEKLFNNMKITQNYGQGQSLRKTSPPQLSTGSTLRRTEKSTAEGETQSAAGGKSLRKYQPPAGNINLPPPLPPIPSHQNSPYPQNPQLGVDPVSMGQSLRKSASASMGSTLRRTTQGTVQPSAGFGTKILVIAPNMFRSHFALSNSFVRILLLQERVEKIKLLIPEYSSLHRNPSDLTTGGKLVVEYFNPHEMAGGRPRPIQMDHKEWAPREHRNSLTSFSGSNTSLFLELAKRKDLISALRAEKFDIGIAELWDHGALPILSMLGIQIVVATQSMPMESIHYAYLGYISKIIEKGDIPELWTAKFDDHKVGESEPHFVRNFRLKVNGLHKTYEELLMKPFREILKKYYAVAQLPSYGQLFSGIRHIFVNTQPFLDFPMPPDYPEKIIHVGGIQLPAYSQFMSSNSNSQQAAFDDIEIQAINASRLRKGLIIISFGSIVSMTKMPDPAFFHFLHAFNTFSEYEFLWKFESEKKLHFNMLRKYSNVHVKKWLNQFDLLENSQTKLFISHCGMNSIIEAIHHAVPILCVPFLADQFYNAEALAKQNAALVANKDDLSEIPAIINEALKSRYKERVTHLKILMDASRPAEKFMEKII